MSSRRVCLFSDFSFASTHFELMANLVFCSSCGTRLVVICIFTNTLHTEEFCLVIMCFCDVWYVLSHPT
jgi:hypothetical protein